MRTRQTRREFMGLATTGLLARPFRFLAPIEDIQVVQTMVGGSGVYQA